MKHSLQVTTYTPDMGRNLGLGVWRQIITELLSAKELILRLMLRDISVRYRQSLLSYAWALITPLILVMLFTFLVSRRVLPVDETILPYPLFVLWNITVWRLFSGILIDGTESLVRAGSLVTKLNFPKEALVISAIGLPVFEFVIRLALIAVAFVWYGLVPSAGIFYIPVILIIIVLMAIGIAFYLSVANLVIRDIGNSLGIILSIMVFLTPVFYPPPDSSPFYLVNILNPLSPLLIATQDLFSQGRLSEPSLLIASSLLSLLIFFSGWRVFHLTLPRVTERA